MLLGRLRYGRSSRAEVCQDADMDRLEGLLVEVADCTLCSSALPLGPRPIVQASARARVLVAGQAPGRKVHESGVAWNDASGVRLREWMGISEEVFYDPARVALLPMGFCYPGTGPSGDLPPRPECAPAWRSRLLNELEDVQLTLVIGRYAQAYHLGASGASVTATVQRWRDVWPSVVPLPHPSPRNNVWLTKNPWFAETLLPALRDRIREVLGLATNQGSLG